MDVPNIDIASRIIRLELEPLLDTNDTPNAQQPRPGRTMPIDNITATTHDALGNTILNGTIGTPRPDTNGAPAAQQHQAQAHDPVEAEAMRNHTIAQARLVSALLTHNQQRPNIQ